MKVQLVKTNSLSTTRYSQILCNLKLRSKFFTVVPGTDQHRYSTHDLLLCYPIIYTFHSDVCFPFSFPKYNVFISHLSCSCYIPCPSILINLILIVILLTLICCITLSVNIECLIKMIL